MCKQFEDWKADISNYCDSNGLSFEKAQRMVKSSNRDVLLLQHFDPNQDSVKRGLGLRDETPMPLVLIVRNRKGRIEIKQTEHTRKYLSK